MQPLPRRWVGLVRVCSQAAKAASCENSLSCEVENAPDNRTMAICVIAGGLFALLSPSFTGSSLLLALLATAAVALISIGTCEKKLTRPSELSRHPRCALIMTGSRARTVPHSRIYSADRGGDGRCSHSQDAGCPRRLESTASKSTRAVMSTERGVTDTTPSTFTAQTSVPGSTWLKSVIGS